MRTTKEVTHLSKREMDKKLYTNLLAVYFDSATAIYILPNNLIWKNDT
jgi:hypothetical protein